MKETIKQKRDAMEQEIRKGKVLLQQQQQAVENTRNKLISLSGAIKVLDELLADDAPNGTEPAPLRKA